MAKTLSTLGIWCAVTIIFVFGVFRFNWNGIPAGVFWFCIAVTLIVAAKTATSAIWQSSREENPPEEVRPK